MLLVTTWAYGQNNCGYVAGYNCATAPIICDLNCLDGFEGTLLDPNSTIIIENLPYQPKALCTLGGTPQNMSWFAFIAGSNYAKITITPFNCKDNSGIQAGMFADCDFSDDLDNTGFPIDSEYIDCDDPFPLKNIPMTLESNTLIPGQTYYFYVDGNIADICSYRVTVDKADQAGSIPDLIKFDQSSVNNDTSYVCPKTKYNLGVEKYPLDIKFFWKVKSPNNYYPFVNYTVLDTQGYEFIFDSIGTYEISMYAYNGCDATDTIKKTLIVRPFDDEKFSDVTICENRFPYAGPQIEDPNKDGVPGWLGPNITAPGISRYTVILTSGCKYEQEINVKTFALQAAKKVIIADCAPFNYHGFNVLNSEQNIPITIGSGDINGCDSLISLDAYILDLKGNLQQQACLNDGIVVAFNQSSISAPPGYKLTYFWKDENGNTLTDNDSDPTNIVIKSKGIFSLEVIIETGGKQCFFDFAGIAIDPQAQLPKIPVANNWDLEVCEGIQTIDYEVTPTSGVTYNWSVTNGAIIQGSTSGSKVTIDASGLAPGSSAQLCVEASNACGTGPKTCSPITVLKKPVINLANDNYSICVDSIIRLSHAQIDPSYKYNWTINQANLVSGNVNTAGPLNISYPTPGLYNVQLVAANKECTSDAKSISIDVIENIDQAVLSYVPTANTILMNWAAVPCAKAYEVYINGTFLASTQALKYELESLKPGDVLNASIHVQGDGICACGISIANLTIRTLTCDEYKLTINPIASTLICEDDWSNPIQLNAVYTNPAIANVQWQGPATSGTGLFSPEKAGPGLHWLKATISDLGCVYQDSVLFTLLKRPNVALNNIDPSCADDINGAIEIIQSDPLQALNYFLDGDKVQGGSMIDNVSIGSHQVEVIDVNNCKVVKTVTINPPVFPLVDVTGGDGPIYDNQKVTLALEDKNSELNLIDSIEWYINGELYCKGNCRNITFSSMEGGKYVHQILIYYDDCVMERTLEFTVKESPKLYFSNIFNTSSSNEANKYFSIMSNDADLTVNEVNIYSRWGELVFTKKNFNPSKEIPLWDGTFNGKDLVPGVYVLNVTYLDEKGLMVKVTKDITLLK